MTHRGTDWGGEVPRPNMAVCPPPRPACIQRESARGFAHCNVCQATIEDRHVVTVRPAGSDGCVVFCLRCAGQIGALTHPKESTYGT